MPVNPKTVMVVVEIVKTLSTDVINSKNQLRELETKGKVFLKALKEHERTVRLSIQAHTVETGKMVEALKIIAENIENPEMQIEAIKQLVLFADSAIKELGEMSKNAFQSLPQPVTRKNLQEDNQ